jgi:hypothetical protein
MAGRATARPVTVKVEGAAALRRSLRAEGANATDLRDVHRTISRDLVAEIRPRVPHRSGDLAASLFGEGTTTKAIVRAGDRSVQYAGPIHFGWPTRPNPAKGWRGGPIRANPFIYDVLDERRAEVIQDYEDRMDELCRRVEAST